MKSRLTLLLIIITALTVHGQDNGYNKNSIELRTGATLASINMFEHQGNKVSATGLDFSLRYTRYFDRHWGAFLQGDLSSGSARRKTYFEKLDRLDGKRYAYTPFKSGATSPARSHAGMFAGITYRYDINRWSFSPRIGAGAASYYLKQNRYYRTEGEGEDAERQAVLIMPTEEENTLSIDRTLAGMTAGLLVSCSLTDYFHIGIDFDLTMFLSRHEYHVRIYETKKREQNIITDGLLLGSLWMENYTKTDLVHKSSVISAVPSVSSISISLGWDF